MKDTRKLAFSSYIRHIANEMGLRDWQIFIANAPPNNSDNLAECDARYGRKIVNIYFSETFLDYEPSRQRQNIVHELLHAHTAFLHHFLRNELNETAFEAYNLALEYAVDGIAEEWARRLPLPEEVG